MYVRVMRTAILAFFVAQTLLSAPSSDLDVRVTKEIDRLSAVLKAIDTPSLSADIKPMVDGNRKGLDRVREATTPLARLYRLRNAYIGIETLRFALDHKSAESSIAAVQKLADASRAGVMKPLATISGPSLQIALQQAAANRAEKLFKASVPYGKVAGAPSGLFYVGEAEANRRFRDFVESLNLGMASEPRPNASAIRAALAKLDTAALAVYDKDPAGRFTANLSSRLKEAHELSDRGWLEGAALTLLEARDDLQKKNLGVNLATTATSKDSIATIFPSYASLFTAQAAEKQIPKSVTVTLVRWPYT